MMMEEEGVVSHGSKIQPSLNQKNIAGEVSQD